MRWLLPVNALKIDGLTSLKGCHPNLLTTFELFSNCSIIINDTNIGIIIIRCSIYINYFSYKSYVLKHIKIIYILF